MSMTETKDIETRIAERIDPAIATSMTIAANKTGGLVFANMNEVMTFAKTMAIAQVGVRKHLRGNVGACLAITVQAIEWQMSPFAVANKSYAVNDQIAYEAQLINAVILARAPIKGRFKVEFEGEGEARKCRVWVKLRDEDEVVDYLSPAFSKILPKNSPLWKTDPDQQQFYYSSRALCRRHFPDVLLGVFAVDDLIDESLEVGPHVARDVTPSRTLSDKLDRLAAPTIDHDSETGEIVERAEKDISEDRSAADDAPGHDAPGIGPAVASQEAEGAAPRQGQTKDAEVASPASASPDHPKAPPQASAGPTPEELSEGEDAAERGSIALTAFLSRFKGAAAERFGAAQIGRWRAAAKTSDKQAEV